MQIANIESIQKGLKESHKQVIHSIKKISEEQAHLIPAPGEWTVAQLLAHIAEIQQFWTSKAILMINEDCPKITRNAVENDIREQTVINKADETVTELLAQCQRIHEETVASLQTIGPSDLQRTGFRGEDHPVKVIEVLQSLIIHINEHIQQIGTSIRLIHCG